MGFWVSVFRAGLLCLLYSFSGHAEAEKDPFITWIHRNRFKGVHNAEVSLCVTPHGAIASTSIATAKKNAGSALLVWLRALAVNDPTITRKVVLSCLNPDYTVDLYRSDYFGKYLRKDLRAYVRSPESDHIRVHEGALSYGLFLHEFGHAFAALGDTYVDDATARCKEGYPASIMCSHTRFGGKLLQPDLLGLRHTYADTYGSFLLASGYQKFCEPWLRGAVFWVEGRKVGIKAFTIKESSISYTAGYPSTLFLKVQIAPDKVVYVPWHLTRSKQESVRRFTEMVEASFH
jgi:hypothetical protein